ncbi:hypothetical protein MPSEU_000131800 [Mayamaea pseudoterrestris]|nr:hypothetical protein MPSEU_000131200 [Mayamaea pseudoterrestris]GKY91599.1 hypothetical protein MPSEU_000131800 [Mayamaea pseudoterrestris]
MGSFMFALYCIGSFLLMVILACVMCGCPILAFVLGAPFEQTVSVNERQRMEQSNLAEWIIRLMRDPDTLEDRRRRRQTSTTDVEQPQSLQEKTDEYSSKTLQLLESRRMTLREKHFVHYPTTEAVTVEVSFGDDPATSSNDSTMVRVPAAGSHVNCDNDQPYRLAEATCAICLIAYETGSQVGWSSNIACEHVFHYDCFKLWLARPEGKSCPCCRREFLVGETVDLKG